MLLFVRPNGALVNPCPQQTNLFRRQPLAFGRHLIVRLHEGHPLNDLALRAFTGHPKRFFRFAAARRIRVAVQPEAAFLFVRPVAFVAALDEDRLDVPRKINLGLVGANPALTHERTRQSKHRREMDAATEHWQNCFSAGLHSSSRRKEKTTVCARASQP